MVSYLHICSSGEGETDGKDGVALPMIVGVWSMSSGAFCITGVLHVFQRVTEVCLEHSKEASLMAENRTKNHWHTITPE